MSKHQKHKHFTEQQKNEILTKYASGNENTITLAEKHNTVHSTVSNIIKGSLTKMNLIKQRIAEECLSDAIRTGKFITDEKLQNSSAHSLVSMRRENVYTAIMIATGNPELGKSSQINLVNIICDLQKVLNPVQECKEAEVIEADVNDKNDKNKT